MGWGKLKRKVVIMLISAFSKQGTGRSSTPAREDSLETHNF
jgi:hypothetical protein